MLVQEIKVKTSVLRELKCLVEWKFEDIYESKKDPMYGEDADELESLLIEEQYMQGAWDFLKALLDGVKDEE